jgi:L-amino acid N-acyltransferase YncA
MERRIRESYFKNVDLKDTFFDSLRRSYERFDPWFQKKADEPVLVISDGRELTGLVYLKVEAGPINDVQPALEEGRWLKVGTMKIVGRGTRLGERVLKRVFDEAIMRNADGIYMTVFEVHDDLIALFARYGFERWGTKGSGSSAETVLVRRLTEHKSGLELDYPFIHLNGVKAWLLAVYPAFHTRLFPDSILKSEPEELVRDVPSANTIHKVYIGRLPLNRVSPGDAIVLYRTTDHQGPARYRSVATSICVAEEVRGKEDFFDENDFLKYAVAHSVFNRDELSREYRSARMLYTLMMTYNASFAKRPTRGELIDMVGISEQPRWDLRQITLEQFREVARLGGVDARIVVD